MQWIHIIQVRCSKFKSVQKWSITPTESRLESSLLESQSISLYNPCVQMLLGSPDHFKTMSRGQRCWKRLWLKLIGLDFRIDIRVYMLCSLFVSHCLHYYAYHISMCIYLYNIDTYQPYIYIYITYITYSTFRKSCSILLCMMPEPIHNVFKYLPYLQLWTSNSCENWFYIVQELHAPCHQLRLQAWEAKVTELHLKGEVTQLHPKLQLDEA